MDDQLMHTPDKQRGFTLIELIVVIIVMTIMVAIGGTAALTTQLNEKRAGVTIREMLMLMDASSSYLETEGEWPNQASSCLNALTYLRDEDGDSTDNRYMAGIDGVSPWQTSYIIGCSGSNHDLLTITVDAVDNDWARYIANGLPASQIIPDANPATNLESRVRVTLTRSLLLATFADKLIQYRTIATNHDNRIPKPDCPTGYEPAIFGAFSGLSYNKKAPPIGAAYVYVKSDDAQYWYVEGELTTPKGTEAPGGPDEPAGDPTADDYDRVRMSITTMCLQ